MSFTSMQTVGVFSYIWVFRFILANYPKTSCDEETTPVNQSEFTQEKKLYQI